MRYMLILGLFFTGVNLSGQEKIILDTDPGYDPDDVGCMAMLHNLANLNEVHILAVINSMNLGQAPATINAINCFYNKCAIPIGSYAYPSTLATPSNAYPYMVAKEFADQLPHQPKVEDGTKLYREVLASAKDKSITVIIIGTMHNFYSLLQSEPDEFSPLTGKALVYDKVKKVVTMGGNFIEGNGLDRTNWGGADDLCAYTEWSCLNEERNRMCRYVIDHCPAPFIASGWEVGCGDYHDANYGNVMTGRELKKLPSDHIVRRCYEYHFKFRENTDDIDRHSNDQCALHYAVRGEGENYTAYLNGNIDLSESGVCSWTDAQNYRQGYIQKKRDPELIAAEIEALMMGEALPSDETPPNTPNKGEVQQIDGKHILKWSPATNPTKNSWVVAYQVFQDQELIGTAYGTKFTVSAPTSSSDYTVHALNAAGLLSAPYTISVRK